MSWKFILVVVILVVGGVGYYIWNQTPDVPKEATLDGYAHSLQRDEQKAQSVASSTNVQLVKEALEKYKSMKGANPASLQDLVPDYIDHIPGGVQYDPASGTVSPVQ